MHIFSIQYNIAIYVHCLQTVFYLDFILFYIFFFVKTATIVVYVGLCITKYSLSFFSPNYAS